MSTSSRYLCRWYHPHYVVSAVLRMVVLYALRDAYRGSKVRHFPSGPHIPTTCTSGDGMMSLCTCKQECTGCMQPAGTEYHPAASLYSLSLLPSAFRSAYGPGTRHSPLHPSRVRDSTPPTSCPRWYLAYPRALGGRLLSATPTHPLMW